MINNLSLLVVCAAENEKVCDGGVSLCVCFVDCVCFLSKYVCTMWNLYVMGIFVYYMNVCVEIFYFTELT